MLIIKIDLVHGQVVPDKQVMLFVAYYIERFNTWKHSVDIEVVVGSEIIVDAFRLAIVEDRISHMDIKFVGGDGKEYELNRYARCLDNMCDSEHIDITSRIIRGATLKSKR